MIARCGEELTKSSIEPRLVRALLRRIGDFHRLPRSSPCRYSNKRGRKDAEESDTESKPVQIRRLLLLHSSRERLECARDVIGGASHHKKLPGCPAMEQAKRRYVVVGRCAVAGSTVEVTGPRLVRPGDVSYRRLARTGELQ